VVTQRAWEPIKQLLKSESVHEPALPAKRFQSLCDGLRERHIAAHRRLFDRVQLRIGPEQKMAITDERLKDFAKSPDPDLLALYFHYGSVLLKNSVILASEPRGKHTDCPAGSPITTLTYGAMRLLWAAVTAIRHGPTGI
jgi:hypothetical protein